MNDVIERAREKRRVIRSWRKDYLLYSQI
ncbi:hypothetical protein NC653_031851 [Populus alba x Populus x berolinensis]|uniref:Uncharacterized protein n=1 Tax=Populus alba x Populus x berolinensis TaxID=444605 RepID=A0AAD6Q252_9ROSI|nr:hypothetical protein NC653_031851 [Populus alba x Populus x berolinensis]